MKSRAKFREFGTQLSDFSQVCERSSVRTPFERVREFTVGASWFDKIL